MSKKPSGRQKAITVAKVVLSPILLKTWLDAILFVACCLLFLLATKNSPFGHKYMT